MSEQAPTPSPVPNGAEALPPVNSDLQDAAALATAHAAKLDQEATARVLFGSASLPKSHPDYNPHERKAVDDYQKFLAQRPGDISEVVPQHDQYLRSMKPEASEWKLSDIAGKFKESKEHDDRTTSLDMLEALAQKLVKKNLSDDGILELMQGGLDKKFGGFTDDEQRILMDRVIEARQQQEDERQQVSVQAAEATPTTPDAQEAEVRRGLRARLLGSLGIGGAREAAAPPVAAQPAQAPTASVPTPILINGRPVDTGRENPTTDIFTTPIRGEETAQRMSLDDIADRLRGAWELDATSQKTDQDKIDQIKNALQSIGHVPDDTTALEVLNRVKAGPARQEPAQAPRAGRARRAGKWVGGAIVGTAAGAIRGVGAKKTARRIEGTATPTDSSNKRSVRQSAGEVWSSVRNGTLGSTGNAAPAAPLTPEQLAEQQLQASREADEALARLRR